MLARRTDTCCLVRSAIVPQPKSLENSAWQLSSSCNQCSGPLRIANIEDLRVRSTSSRRRSSAHLGGGPLRRATPRRAWCSHGWWGAGGSATPSAAAARPHAPWSACPARRARRWTLATAPVKRRAPPRNATRMHATSARVRPSAVCRREHTFPPDHTMAPVSPPKSLHRAAGTASHTAAPDRRCARG
eukprot:1191941-Prorocentrum_minimum.AAC.1